MLSLTLIYTQKKKSKIWNVVVVTRVGERIIQPLNLMNIKDNHKNTTNIIEKMKIEVATKDRHHIVREMLRRQQRISQLII